MHVMDADCAIVASSHLETLSDRLSEQHGLGHLYSVLQVYGELVFRERPSRAKSWAQEFAKKHPNFFVDLVDRTSVEYREVQRIITLPDVNPFWDHPRRARKAQTSDPPLQ